MTLNMFKLKREVSPFDRRAGRTWTISRRIPRNAAHTTVQGMTIVSTDRKTEFTDSQTTTGKEIIKQRISTNIMLQHNRIGCKNF